MKTKLYQVFYDTNQLIDPLCEPINAIGVDVGDIYENTHILNAYKKGFEGADYYGVVSWRLLEKTGLYKANIDNFINNNKADVYTFYSNNEDMGNQLRVNTDSNSPIGLAVKRIIELGVFKNSDLEDRWVNVYANYFMATKEVWDAYIPLLEKVIELGSTDEKLKELLKEKFNHRGSNYPLFCFVLEYLFGLFLADNPQYIVKKVDKKKKGFPGKLGSIIDLLNIYEKHKAEAGFGDKGTLHNYIESYGELFHDYRHKPINFLEIGVCRGGSLNMWREFFTRARIIGIDINEPTLAIPGCEFHICDQNDPRAIEELFSDTKFDIIVDDGSHVLEHQVTSFKSLFDKLNTGGLYIIEDVGGVSKRVDYEIEQLKKLGECTVIDTRGKSGRYDDILMIWKK